MNAKQLTDALKSNTGSEVYVPTAEGHQLVHGVRLVRFNGNGPMILEVVTNEDDIQQGIRETGYVGLD